jgi:hypothetical protein
MKPAGWVAIASALIAIMPAGAQTKLVTEKVKLRHTPAIWFENAFVDTLGFPKTRYPRGITAIIASEGDNTVIIRGEREAAVGLADSFRALDVEPRQMKLTLRAVPYVIETGGKRTDGPAKVTTAYGVASLPQIMQLEVPDETIVARLTPRLNRDNTVTVEAAVLQVRQGDRASAEGVRRLALSKPAVIANFVRAEPPGQGPAFANGARTTTGRRIGVDVEITVVVEKPAALAPVRQPLSIYDGSL